MTRTLMQNRRIAGFRALALMLLCALALMGFTNPFADNVRKGNEAYEKGELDQALGYYTQAQKDAPDSPELSYNIGNVRYRQKNFEEAVAQYRQAMIAPDKQLRQKAAYNIGNAHFLLEKYADAQKAYKEALRLDPADQDAKYNLELATRMLEQQQQQEKDSCDNPEPSENDKKNEDQKDKDKQDSDKEQDQKEQKQQQQQEQQQQDQPKDQQQQQQQQEQEKKEQEEKQPQPANPEDEQPTPEPQEASAAQKSDQPPPEDFEGEDAMLVSPEQALQILDALIPEEQEEQRKQLQAPISEEDPDKDW